MSPAEIKICLHYYTAPGDAENIHLCSEMFVSNGLLETNDTPGRQFQSTEKNDAYCKMLQEVPLPIRKWVDPR